MSFNTRRGHARRQGSRGTVRPRVQQTRRATATPQGRQFHGLQSAGADDHRRQDRCRAKDAGRLLPR